MTTKDDKNKLSWHLLMKYFVNELTQLVRVLEFGARKYGETNYKTVPNFEDRYLSALYRHLNAATADPYSRDPDTGLSHYAHVVANALFLLQRINEENEYAHALVDAPKAETSLQQDTWVSPITGDFLQRVKNLQQAYDLAQHTVPENIVV